MKVCLCGGNIKGCALISYIYLGYKMQPNRIWRNNLQKSKKKKSVNFFFKYILANKTAIKSVQLLNDKSITISQE